MKYKNLRPSQILLDPENARLPDGTSNDKEAINRLLADGGTQLISLARDLVDRGEANPSELPIVIAHGTKYLVVEGNRRFAALKLLSDPKLADDPGHRAAFERLKSRYSNPLKTVYCAIADSREQADPWLKFRHTGANDGVGVRVWSSEQVARHRRRMRAPIDSGTLRSIIIADELTEAYQADLELVDIIKRVRADRLTNIGRLFSPDVLARMQLQVRQAPGDDTSYLWSRYTSEQLRGFFAWAFHFLDDNSVDAFKNQELRRRLLDDRASMLPNIADSMQDYVRLANRPPGSQPSTAIEAEESDNSGTERDGEDESRSTNGSGSGNNSGTGGGSGSTSAGGNGDAGNASGQDSRNRRDQQPERTLYSKVRLPNLSPNIQRLLREARQLPIEENYATACVLARVILELAVSDSKVLRWSGKKEGDRLAEKIRGCILKLDPLIDTPKRSRQDLTQANLETGSIGVTYMHQFMHNPSAVSDPHLARRFSSIYTPLLISINEAVK